MALVTLARATKLAVSLGVASMYVPIACKMAVSGTRDRQIYSLCVCIYVAVCVCVFVCISVRCVYSCVRVCVCYICVCLSFLYVLVRPNRNTR